MSQTLTQEYFEERRKERKEIATALMAGLVTTIQKDQVWTTEQFSDLAIECADALIYRLNATPDPRFKEEE